MNTLERRPWFINFFDMALGLPHHYHLNKILDSGAKSDGLLSWLTFCWFSEMVWLVTKTLTLCLFCPINSSKNQSSIHGYWTILSYFNKKIVNISNSSQSWEGEWHFNYHSTSWAICFNEHVFSLHQSLQVIIEKIH